MENLIEINRKKRIFTIEEAQKMLPLIMRLTDESVKEVKALSKKIEFYDDQTHQDVQILETRLSEIIKRWQTKVEMLGPKPSGMWFVDFDNGAGYFCWKYPEAEINFCHGYQDGNSGRILIK